jgi:Family of unknown function (DUF6153)
MSVSRWSFVATALLGLVAIHGMGSHGVHSVEPAGAVASMHHMASEAVDQQAAGVVSASQRDSAGALALGASCLAILIGLGFAIRAIARSSTPVARRGDIAVAYSFATAGSQNRSPPTLAALSILRC